MTRDSLSRYRCGILLGKKLLRPSLPLPGNLWIRITLEKGVLTVCGRLMDRLQIDENGLGIPLDKINSLLDYGHESAPHTAAAAGGASCKLEATAHAAEADNTLYLALYGLYGHGLSLALTYLGHTSFIWISRRNESGKKEQCVIASSPGLEVGGAVARVILPIPQIAGRPGLGELLVGCPTAGTVGSISRARSIRGAVLNY